MKKKKMGDGEIVIPQFPVYLREKILCINCRLHRRLETTFLSKASGKLLFLIKRWCFIFCFVAENN